MVTELSYPIVYLSLFVRLETLLDAFSLFDQFSILFIIPQLESSLQMIFVFSGLALLRRSPPTTGADIYVRRRQRCSTALAAYDGVLRRSTAFDGVLKIFICNIFILFENDFKRYPNEVSVVRTF